MFLFTGVRGIFVPDVTVTSQQHVMYAEVVTFDPVSLNHVILLLSFTHNPFFGTYFTAGERILSLDLFAHFASEELYKLDGISDCYNKMQWSNIMACHVELGCAIYLKLYLFIIVPISTHRIRPTQQSHRSFKRLMKLDGSNMGNV